MDTLSLFEQLAFCLPLSSSVDNLLQKAPSNIQEAFLNRNAELIKSSFSQTQRYADRTTIIEFTQ